MIIEDDERYVRPAIEIFCPRCKSLDVVLNVENGYFWIALCKRCGYSYNKESSKNFIIKDSF